MRNKWALFLFIVFLFSVPVVCAASPASIDLNFDEEDIRIVLHTLAAIGGMGMVIDDSVKGNVSIRLSNVAFDTALDLITRAKGLSYRKVGETIVIEPAYLGATDIIKLKYARAADLKDSLNSVWSELKLKTEADEATNSLVVSGSPAGIDRIKSIIGQLDIPRQQVELEAKVVAINKTHAKDLGIDWTWEAFPQSPEVTTEYETQQVATRDADGNVTGSTSVSIPKTTVTRSVNAGVIRIGRNPEGHPYEFYYQAKISALISKGNAKMLAQPKVTTINGKEARILIGDRVPTPVESTDSSGRTTTTIQYVDAGIKLTYTPFIDADDMVAAKVHTEVSTPTLVDAVKAYRITTREAETNVRMKNGETMVIGGLIGEDQSESINKIPFLGDLPILGSLFHSRHTSKNDTEVVIFLTAHIVK